MSPLAPALASSPAVEPVTPSALAPVTLEDVLGWLSSFCRNASLLFLTSSTDGVTDTSTDGDAGDAVCGCASSACTMSTELFSVVMPTALLLLLLSERANSNIHWNNTSQVPVARPKWYANAWEEGMTVDTNSLRYISRQSSKNCGLYSSLRTATDNREIIVWMLIETCYGNKHFYLNVTYHTDKKCDS